MKRNKPLIDEHIEEDYNQDVIFQQEKLWDIEQQYWAFEKKLRKQLEKNQAEVVSLDENGKPILVINENILPY